jgi:hypothetical protein
MRCTTQISADAADRRVAEGELAEPRHDCQLPDAGEQQGPASADPGDHLPGGECAGDREQSAEHCGTSAHQAAG